jgi:hypothetical protein
MTDSNQTRPTARRLFAWEARWIPVEMAGTAIGLVRGLSFDRWDTATFCLFSVCIVSCVVRRGHYTAG